MHTDFKVFGVMSLKPSRRSLDVVPKVKLGDLRPLPEPVEKMAIEVEETPVSVYQDSLLDTHVAVNMLSTLQLDGAASGNSTPFLSREGSFDDIFAFDSADDDDQERSWQLSGDTGSSDFGNSVTSFMSWTDDVEVETTRKVQDLVDELERCFYGEESLDKLKKEVAAECFDWRSKFPHFRVRGAGIQSSSLHLQRLYEKECMDDKVATDEAAHVVLEDEGDGEEEEEVIASHGSCQEQLELNEHCNRNDNSRPYIAQDNVVMCYNRNRNRNLSARSLRQKVKDSVMEQLFSYAWSEVSKSLEPLLHFYSESTFQQRPGHPASLQGQSRMNNPRLPAVDTPFTPIPDVHDTELEQCVSAKSVHCSGRRTLICPVLQQNLNGDESVLSQLARTGLAVDSVLPPREPPIISLPKPLSLHSANYSLAPTPTLESRGYHSAADGRTRPVLTRRFRSVTSRHESFLKPLEEQQTMAAKVTTTPRQVSAPTSPPNWSRHVTLPPIDHLDPCVKGLSLQCEPKFRGTEVRPMSRTSAKQKLQGLHSVCESKMWSPGGSSRSRMSVQQKVSLLPIDLSGPISIQGTGLSKTDCAKQMLDMHEDPGFEEKNGVISSAKDRRGRWKLRGRRHLN